MTAEAQPNHRANPMLVDPACVELADYFLEDVKGHVTEEDRTEFAEAIQRICEDWCNALAAEIQRREK